MFYQNLPARQRTWKVCEERVLKMDVARLSKYTQQLRVQRKRFERIMERFRNGRAVCCLSASFCVGACANGYCCAKKNNSYELHHEKLLFVARLRYGTFRQKTVSSYDRLADFYCVLVQASRKFCLIREFSIHYGKTD